MAKQRRSRTAKADAAERARELKAARRRALGLKALFTTIAAAIFSVGLIVTKQAFAGHAKEPTRPLAAPPRYVQIVKKNLLQAGVVGPAQAPPGAASAAS